MISTTRVATRSSGAAALSLRFIARRVAFTVGFQTRHRCWFGPFALGFSPCGNRDTVHSLRPQSGAYGYINCTQVGSDRPDTARSSCLIQLHCSIAQPQTYPLATSTSKSHNRMSKFGTRLPAYQTAITRNQSRRIHYSTKATMEPTTPLRPATVQQTVDSGSSPEGSIASTQATAATTPALTPEVLADLLGKYNLTEDTLHKVHDVFVELAEAAGVIMVNAEHDVLAQAGTKNNTSDLVSDYDKKIEAMIKDHLANEFPDFEFLGEESYKHGQKLNDGPTFIVDPVDGTINFTRGFHNFAISLAFAIEKKTIVALVYSPNLGKLFTATKTHGAFLVNELFVPRQQIKDQLERENNDPVVQDIFGDLTIQDEPKGQGKAIVTGEVKPTFKAKMAELPKYKLPLTPIPAPMPSLKERLIAIEWANERMGPNWDLRTDVHTKLLTNDKAGGKFILSCRSSGSAALDFCYVAAGNFDAFWEGGVWVWDVAAGWLIVEEAGGIVASANPGNWHPTLEGRTYFPVRGAKREEQEAVVKEMWEVMGDRKFVYADTKAPKDGGASAAVTK
ncbi:Inositol-phosphate phosphatase [Ascochyta lentis]